MTMSCQVNTHFSFPFQLDMSAYMEHTLIPGKAQQAPAQSPIYELIGETVVMAFGRYGKHIDKKCCIWALPILR